MSSLSQTVSSPILEQPLHRNLISILRRANERYRHIANDMRLSTSRTHHAQKLAAMRGLRVDTYKAIRCPQKYVSVEPLPVIEICSPIRAPVFISKPVALRTTAADVNASVPKRIVPVLPTIIIPAVHSDRRCVARVAEEVEVASPSSHFSVSPEDDDFRHSVDVPSDESGSDWSLDDSEYSEYSDVSLSSTEGSCGLITPDDFAPSAMRIKRKSSQMTGMNVLEKRQRLDVAA
ncbi:hypothetical protein HGRIS_007318 [Hohenbuehelia grisea]|uniref:Uncharacterized protein n=1 Tax=Hohenbuehelia grisea TaxID=104357 RepID=A0ABR3J4E2_9AGAR